ncbi:uncharacterized protein LOC111880955 [Lactuca sativa]|uniref:uncharacterized protein LOC111880955 n=1 Tax=Lactuca sativa TaxID=4236 RepID=UPI000CD8427F|nr:uncharacterized protein LOC111880955 [Lactuca sativa]
MKIDEAGIHIKLEIEDLEEIKNEAFESSRIYKDKTKAFHDKYLSRWVGPFIVTNVFGHGAVEIKSNKTGKAFKVNGHRLKVFYEGFQEKDIEVDSLERLNYIE